MVKVILGKNLRQVAWEQQRLDLMCVRNKGFKLSKLHVSLKVNETDNPVAHDLVFYAVCRIPDAPVSKSSNYMTAVFSMFGVVVRKIGYLEKPSARI